MRATRRSKLTALIITAAVVIIFAVGTLLMNVIKTGYCAGTIVRIKEYEIPIGYTVNADLSQMVSRSVYKFDLSTNKTLGGLQSGQTGFTIHEITIAGLTGVKTVLIPNNVQLNTQRMRSHPYHFTGGIKEDFFIDSSFIDMRVGDFTAIKYTGKDFTDIFCNISPRHFFSTNPLINIVFASVTIACIFYLALSKRTKHDDTEAGAVKFYLTCLAIGTAVSIILCLATYFKFYRYPADFFVRYDLAYNDKLRLLGIDRPGIVVFAILLTTILFLIYRTIKARSNEVKHNRLKIITAILIAVCITGISVRNMIQWEKVDRSIVNSQAITNALTDGET